MNIGRKKELKTRLHQFQLDLANPIRLGHAEVDEQHSRMFLLANAIVNSLVDDGSEGARNNSLELLQDFIDFSYQHFRFEEDLMRSIDYPDLESHAKAHSALLEEIAGHRYKFELGHSDFDQIVVYFRDWLVRHIDREDRELVDWLDENARMTTPAADRGAESAESDELKPVEPHASAGESAEEIISRLMAASRRGTRVEPHPAISGAHIAHAGQKGWRNRSAERKQTRRFDASIAATVQHWTATPSRALLLRQTIGLLGLTLAYLQYYFVDVQLQIASLPPAIALPFH